MVNAKTQLDFLLRLNKIVIFGNDNYHSRNSLIASSTPINNQNNTTIAEFLKNETISIETVSSLTKTVDDLDIDLNELKKSQHSITDRLSKLNGSTNNKSIDLNSLLELYGVASKYITYIYMNKLNNSSDCEAYIRKKFCFNQDLNYPIIFLNGIYFGSNDEINYAHNEGILFELLSNVGLFESNNNPISNGPALDNLKNKFSINSNKKQSSLNNNHDQDLMAIDKVAKFNNSSNLIQQSSNISMIKNDRLNNDSDEDDDLSSANSSISSIDKQVICENYVKNNNKLLLSDKKGITNKQSIKKEVSFSKMGLSAKNHNNNHTSKDYGKNIKTKTTTPPAQVLATINKWLTETKKVIDNRNKEIIRRKNFS
jgi:hypothetical protein